jgi:hypothetical protein
MIVVTRRAVAGLAIVKTIMAEVGISPATGIVAVGTLAGKMSTRRCVTRLAIGQPIVTKINIRPS